MKIFWIARTCPYPPNDGEKIRVYNLLRQLSAKHELTLVCRVMNEEELEGLAELRKICARVHGEFIPSPHGFFEKFRWLIPFVFSQYPLGLSTVFFKQIADVIRQIGAGETFDIVQVEHSSLTIYLDYAVFRGNPARLLTMHNIDYIRNDRIIANTRIGIGKAYHLVNQARFKNWELKSLRRYDGIITMSELDSNILNNDIHGLPLHVVENGVDAVAIPFKPEKRLTDRLIFVASMDSEANHDGAMYFVKDIFPLISKARPTASIAFVGRNPRKELLDLHNRKGIVVTGKVTDVFAYYSEAAIAIVPLRSGSGTRLKILEAMAAGVPVVSTSIGCEGLTLCDGEHLLISDTPRGFADCIARLLEDDPFREEMIRKARALVENEYDWGLIAKKHEKVYNMVVTATHA